MSLKVAIITFLSDNYGTCLQGYALLTACESLGCQSIIIKNLRRQNRKKTNKLLARIKLMTNSLLKNGLQNSIRIRKVLLGKKQAFSSFRKENMRITAEEYKSLETLGNKYNLFIAGSDMVWSGEFINYAHFYFLDGVPENKTGSYAPSFGKGIGGTENKQLIGRLLNRIRFLSCREHSGGDIIREMTGREAAFVCDPTLLFDKNQWKSFFNIKDTKADSVLVNCFGGLPPKFKKSAEKIKDKYHVKMIRYLNSDVQDLRNEWQYGSGMYGPIQFIQMVNDCVFTIVNGYHGLLFALIFEKPFFVLHRAEKEHWSEHENRMEELLEYLDLKQRYIYPGDSIDEMDLAMDYTAIREKLNSFKEESWNYLKNMINSIKVEALDDEN